MPSFLNKLLIESSHFYAFTPTSSMLFQKTCLIKKQTAGVSGSGDSSTFSIQQIEKALNDYNQFYINGDSLSESDILTWDKEQILNFIQNCLATAKIEGSVRVYFG